MISIIVAYDLNRNIGFQGQMPWKGKLPADLKRFKELTTGHWVVMGRKTFESIGGPLPNRRNFVLTHNPDYLPDDVIVWNSRSGWAMKALAGRNVAEVFVIGGAEVYKQALPFATKLYLTEIQASFEGDTKFPETGESEWGEVEREEHQRDEKNHYDYVFRVLERERFQVLKP
jgi:dihydrofolate reductase